MDALSEQVSIREKYIATANEAMQGHNDALNKLVDRPTTEMERILSKLQNMCEENSSVIQRLSSVAQKAGKYGSDAKPSGDLDRAFSDSICGLIEERQAFIATQQNAIAELVGRIEEII